MIPLFLTVLGGYLIGDSMKPKIFDEGGDIKVVKSITTPIPSPKPELKVVTRKEEIIKYFTRNSGRYLERDLAEWNELFSSGKYIEQSNEIIEDLTKEYLLFYELNPNFKKIPLIIYENKIKFSFGEGEIFRYDFLDNLFVFSNSKEYIRLKKEETTPINDMCDYVYKKYENKI